MKLPFYKIPIKTGKLFLAVLHIDDAAELSLKAGDRLKLQNTSKNYKEITAICEISEEKKYKNKIGLYTETIDQLNATTKDEIKIKVAETPISVQYIKNKLNAHRLTEEEINEIVKDIVEDDLSKSEMSYFIAACYVHGLDDYETAFLTKAIVNNGQTIKFSDGRIVDKHCIGGVPGNRTTMLIVPILTAAGLKMPKTSSRSITSPAGTADTMEVLANVTVEADQLYKIAQKVNGFIAWGGGVDIASADDKLITLRHTMSLDPQGMLIASIMAKKFAVGSTDVLIDIPYGEQVKVKTKNAGSKLKKRFEKIGKLLGMNVKVILTKGEQPIGNGIGPVLEAVDVMKVLKQDKDRPRDLEEKSLEMAGMILEMSGTCKRNQGYKLAKQILTSKEALAQMKKIIKSQGKSKIKIQKSKVQIIHKADKNGKLTFMHNKLISLIARTAGSPNDPYAGVYLHQKVGDKFKKGENIITIHGSNKSRCNEAYEILQENIQKIFTIKEI